MSSQVIHLAFAFDKNYITQCYVLLTSVLLNNKSNTIQFHAIAPDVSQDDKDGIIDFISKNNSVIRFYDIDKDFVQSFVMQGAGYTHAIYYRLFFPHLLSPEIERLIYIDSDTLVINNLSNFFLSDIGAYPVAAVTDTEMPVRTDLGIDKIEDYFNSGVLLINLSVWKNQEITEKTIRLINESPDQIKNYPDQDALNMILKDNWFKLPLNFNLMKAYVPDDLPKRKIDKFLADKVIVHYNGLKPWTIYCEHKLRFLYHYYLRLSPKKEEKKYKSIVLNRKALRRIFFVRALELYFDYPEIGRVWRRIKSRF